MLATPYGPRCVIEEDFSVGNRALPVARTVLAILAASLLTACGSALPTGPAEISAAVRPTADLGVATGVAVGVVIQADSTSSIYAVAYEDVPPGEGGGEGSSEP